MRILLGSGGFRTPERVALLRDQMRSFFGPVRGLLFVPYAAHDYDAYVRIMLERELNAGYDLDSIHRHADPRQAVRSAEALYLGGGNTFRLLDALYRHDLLTVIRERVGSGLPYLGVSAGSNVACPTMQTTNDMPIVQPPSFAALGLVPFQINPHYYHGATFVRDGETYCEHFGETRDQRLGEFHQENETPVIGLWEGGMLRIENDSMTLIGAAARVFRKDSEPVDVMAGQLLDELLHVTPS